MSKYRRLRSLWQRMFKYAVGLSLCEQNPADAIMTYKELGGDTRKKRARLSWDMFLQILETAKKTPRMDWFADALTVQIYTAVDRSTLMSMHENMIRDRVVLHTQENTSASTSTRRCVATK